ncbi:MAG TPA: Gfo/Idh/MocA family oxidoreductase [Acidimicrobiales bacterium]|nr:Gfo/Idh/MocA family oxidoreductase [Acidimicrobiales bacterium]
MTVDVAIVGCGVIGRKRAQALAGRGRVVAVHDVDSARAGALASELGTGTRVCADAKEAFEAASGGLAVVATTHDSLVRNAVQALEAGCHVLVEKPGARSHGELAEVAKAADNAARLARVGFNHRFHPAMLRAHELLASGRFGPVAVIRARYGHGGRLGYEREWRASRERSGGGELLDQGVHLLDLVRFFAGEPRLAYAVLPTLFWPMEVEDNAFLHLTLPESGHAWLHASWTEWKNLFSFEISCRTAKIEITGLGGSYGPERLTLYEMSPEMGPPTATTWEWPAGDHSWAAELDDVLAELDGGPALGAKLEDALGTLALVEEAYAR